MKLRNLILAGFLLGMCVLNIMVSVERAEANRELIYGLRVGHAEFRWWLAETIEQCSPLIFQRKGESAQEAMDRLPDDGGCLVFGPGIQTAMSEEAAVVIPKRFVNTRFSHGYFRGTKGIGTGIFIDGN